MELSQLPSSAAVAGDSRSRASYFFVSFAILLFSVRLRNRFFTLSFGFRSGSGLGVQGSRLGLLLGLFGLLWYFLLFWGVGDS